MSVQFGRWNFDGHPPAVDFIHKVGALLAPYGPDSDESYSKNGVHIVFRAFHTTNDAHHATQPIICPSGAVITWDGRLDNRAELIAEWPDLLSTNCPDAEIVAVAYERRGVKCFGRLIGHWALSIFNPASRSLILAKDAIGTRHLYYTFDRNHSTWSTTLTPLALFAGKNLELCEEYVAGWFSMFPDVRLTPYVGVHSVPPGSFVFLQCGRHNIIKYWAFDPGKRIRYRTDGEYEEHFRDVFTTAVRRTLRSDYPILAELSGGRDSSAIVCMADTIIAKGQAECPGLDTISYYDDSEPNWNERPYFTKVEEKRGRTGYHINIGLHDRTEKAGIAVDSSSDRFVPAPASDSRTSPQIRACLKLHANRVVLSGIGGDEVMGGVPMPIPELQDLLARARFLAASRQLKAWALQKRLPWFHLFFEAVKGFFPPKLVGVEKYLQPVSWLHPDFVRRHWCALTGYSSRIRLFGPSPTFQDNLRTLDALQRQLAVTPLRIEPPYEKRYPYLDRCLLEFMFAIPREQLVRPAQRRSLMRRALVGIVPDEILNKNRKANVARAPVIRIARDWHQLVETTHDMVSCTLGIVDSERLCSALHQAGHGSETPIVPLLRAIQLETWLRNLREGRIVNLDSIRTTDMKVSSVPGPQRYETERDARMETT